MNGQSNGSPKGMLGKKMFSLIAVALMVASCLVVVAAVDVSNAETDAGYYSYNLNYGSEWTLLEDRKVPGVTYNSSDSTLTFDNVNATFLGSIVTATGGQINDNVNPFTIIFKGQNTISVQTNEDSLNGFYCDADNFVVKGQTGASLDLSFTTANGNCTAFHGVKEISDISINVSFKGNITDISGVLVNQDLTITNSTINIGSAESSDPDYVGINVPGDFEIDNSSIIVNSNDNGSTGTAIGVLLGDDSTMTVSDSGLLSSAHNHAICCTISGGYGDIPNSFKDIGVVASDKCINPSYSVVTEDTINKDYKSVIIGSLGHTLSFDKDGGEGRAPESVKLASGEHYTIPACKLTKDGCDADGWVDSNGKVYHAGDDFVMGDSDVVLKPHWNTGIGVSMTILAIIIFFSILLIIGIVFAVRKYEE